MAISNHPELIELEGKVLHQTDMAVLIDFGLEEPSWVPKSVMEDWPDIGEYGEVLVQEWFATKEELI